ncbi:MAG: pentapeptide repeat-containing protein [Gammaproteobacteria bacterium]|nr:pentapeptide repeat-containing protein [Gammaproteobacteria bacterium]
MAEPVIKNDNHLYRLLRDGQIKAFNEARERGEKADLTGCDFRGVDLRGMNADGLDLSNGYFRQADLRGINFSTARLEGASIHATKISGVFFPKELSAEEITLSLLHGTRLRCR